MLHRLYFVLCVVTMLYLHYLNNFIENRRVLEMEQCEFQRHSLVAYPFIKCNGKCYYLGQEIDDCHFISPFIFLFSCTVVMLYVLFPCRKIDVYFFHFIVQLGYWYCAIKYDYKTAAFDTLVLDKAVYLGFVVPLYMWFTKKNYERFWKTTTWFFNGFLFRSGYLVSIWTH